AGPDRRGYYSFDVGPWHLISLNSNVPATTGSTQDLWLRADLSANLDKRCGLAYWHHPVFSSGPHGNDPTMAGIWQTLRFRCRRSVGRPRSRLRAVWTAR